MSNYWTKTEVKEELDDEGKTIFIDLFRNETYVINVEEDK